MLLKVAHISTSLDDIVGKIPSFISDAYLIKICLVVWNSSFFGTDVAYLDFDVSECFLKSVTAAFSYFVFFKWLDNFNG